MKEPIEPVEGAVRVTAAAATRIIARADRMVAERAEARFRELVLEWARAQDGAFPTRDLALADARAELEVLCRGLGGWAALPPEEVFPQGLTPVERLLRREDEW